MPLRITRLRRWFAVAAIIMVTIVAGAYYFAKWRVENALKRVPGKLSIDIQQSAEGFTISKSDAGRTIFKIQASKVVQFKESGKAQLHDVAITLYGRDSNRFDQIYGTDFEYDQKSGDVIANGEVQIDLEANPEGIVRPDQAVPKELKNPIHLKTGGLTFNAKTGNAFTKEKVEFRIPQANGTAVGASYSAKDNALTLQSEIKINFNGPNASTLTALHAVLTKNPQVITLSHLHLNSTSQVSEADEATVYLRHDNTVEKMEARGNVKADSVGDAPSHIRATNLEVLMAQQGDTLRSAAFYGDVQISREGEEPLEGRAGRMAMNFAGKRNQLANVHTEDSVKFVQHQKAATGSTAQDIEITAPVMDFFLNQGHSLERAETSGPPQILMHPAGPGADQQQTLATASKFEAKFDKSGQLSAVHGASDSRIVTKTQGQPDRLSTSDTMDAVFRPGKGIESITQQGNFAYVDGNLKAWADHARYTPADHMLTLSGSPRVVDGGMTTTARSMRMDRSTGDAFADGDVKSTYSDLKPQSNGALLASSSPIHVTAQSMTAHHASSKAVYTGKARLWQDANVIEAPTLEFDRDQRSVVAHGTANQTVSTVLIQADKTGKVTPANVTGTRLTYTDSDRKAHFEGNVVGKWADMTVTTAQMDIFMQPRSEAGTNSSVSAGKLDHMVAQGHVVITQPKRHATGEQLVYTATDDKFVLTGGPPSIFDAEQGNVTGVSLTLFRHDDRVLVEGNSASPVVTQTRVAR